MPQYVIVYLGGNPPTTPEEGQQHMAKYKQWLDDLGDAVISPANPLKNTHTITPNGSTTAGSSVGMSGYTIIEADNVDAAVAITKACPFLHVGGTLEVSELMQMSF